MRARGEIKIDRDLVLKVGRKARIEGLIKKRILLIAPVIDAVMKNFVRGDYDEILKGKAAQGFEPQKVSLPKGMLLIRRLRLNFEDRAVYKGKINRYCHARNLIERLFVMYINDEIKIVKDEN